jgi:hypothetical protein
MAGMEKDDFKFPDEQEETKGKPEDTEAELDISFEGDDVQIEVKDDTPAEDQDVEPLPDDIKEELEAADKSKEYSKNVKDKFVQYKKAWHDERRAKEAAYREQQEALNLAQKILDENKKLKEMLQYGEKELISTYQSSAEMEIEKAKRNYKEAYDSGDSDRLLEAQEELMKAQLKLDKAKNFKPTVQIPENDVQIPQKQSQQPAQLDPKVAEWVSKNQWFVDPNKRAMRKYAEGVHEELEETYGRGFVGTDEYYKRIDVEVKRRFPEEFADTQNDEEEKPQRTAKLSTVVAPAKRSTSSKKIVLTKSQVALAKKFGLSPEQYARELTKLEA